MKLVLSKILGRYGDFTNVEPLLALFLKEHAFARGLLDPSSLPPQTDRK